MSELFLATSLRDRLSSRARRLCALLSGIWSEAATAGERHHLRALSAELGVLDEWLSPSGGLLDAWRTREGSELADDDAVAKPYELSPAIWAAATAAVSHLDCLRDSVLRLTADDPQETPAHVHGHLALARGAIENASMAVWLLEPEDSAQRILRRLQTDWREHQRATRGFPPTGTIDDHFVDLAAAASGVGIDPERIKQCPSYAEIVRSAGKYQLGGSDFTMFTWKACGAVAHGELRGSSAYLPRDVLRTAVADRSPRRSTGSVRLLADGGLLAAGIARVAFDLYARRAGPSW
ncbi:hypothetical protein [Rugosimonospora africana]|uniref:Uncharacterized protein n=1 Tax=Rugosimonospora africana TaxID=556532 RepID=A0A8J3VS34_9ACTN|nr:hypothetical protein [Rugosimonospora africana]GIH16842.1 hypothetical protein Raf01_50140 [Rugosimonospora africana]